MLHQIGDSNQNYLYDADDLEDILDDLKMEVVNNHSFGYVATETDFMFYVCPEDTSKPAIRSGTRLESINCSSSVEDPEPFGAFYSGSQVYLSWDGLTWYDL